MTLLSLKVGPVHQGAASIPRIEAHITGCPSESSLRDLFPQALSKDMMLFITAFHRLVNLLLSTRSDIRRYHF
jgi:hypothetical protein